MGQRNMVCTSQMLELEMDQQGQGYLRPEPCILLGNIVHYPHPNVHPVLSASGNARTSDIRHLQENRERGFFYGNQFNSLQHQHQHHPHPITNISLGSAVPSNYYTPYMVPPSGNGICPLPLNHGLSEPSSSSHGIIGVDTNEYEGNNYFMDEIRGSGKRKNVQGNYHLDNNASSSNSFSLGVPVNTSEEQFESGIRLVDAGAQVIDPVAHLPPEFGLAGIQSITEAEAARSVRSRSSTIGLQLEATVTHNQNYIVEGNYLGQTFQPASDIWVEQHFENSYSPATPYINARRIDGGTLEIASTGGHGYSESFDGRSSAILLHSSSMHHHHHPHFHHHHPPFLMQQTMQGYNYSYHPQPPPSYRLPTNNTMHHGTPSPFDVLETGVRYTRPSPSNGLRIYRPHRNGVRQTTLDNSDRTRLRILAEDDVAILDIPGFYEVGNVIDRHREMRLDIDDMSYEELLALGERIGNVQTGLVEETISNYLKTRVHMSSSTCTADKDHESSETCIICQVEYENQEMIGTLDCGHEYHADCVKQWLRVKNVCPICKVPALTVEDGHE
ncbi:hypothetical protein GIB67_039267 [Kingdonia uniflora]|uniref:RING-type E3 ubiquitin transferase n=1 Tax=Kingdonia uniflora TaxID=39325 RepID=A0A7J7MM20_9MAGN|nr:hypothetical protein GIB67_039267 [Kingdonia uniflora]